jgi:hypothetical protein
MVILVFTFRWATTLSWCGRFEWPFTQRRRWAQHFGGVWFLRHGGFRLRWGIGLLGFALLAFASWSSFQLLTIYRQLSADPMMVAKLGPGLIVVVVGSLLIFATLFLNDE